MRNKKSRKALTRAQESKAVAALSRAIKIVGSQRKLAFALHKQPQVVTAWMKKRSPVGGTNCVPIEKLTHGEVKAAELRPDLFKQ